MEEEKKSPKPTGGFREGAGRKPKDGVGTEHIGLKINRVHLSIIRDLVEKGEFKSVSEFICMAVKEKLRREELV